MIKLHPYQQDLVRRVHDAWTRVLAVLMVLATGGGKTYIFSSIIHDHNGAAAAVVHRREIVAQISMSLAKLDVKHRIIAQPKTVEKIRRQHLRELGKSFIDPHARCGVVSVQTLTSKASGNNEALQRWVNQVTLAVFDEGHHYVDSGLWSKAVELFSRAKLLFVTATPERADGKGLGVVADGYCAEMVEGPQSQWLIDNKYLAPFKYFAPTSDLNIEGVPITASGDLNTKAMRKRIVESHLVGDVVEQYLQFTPGEQAIGFANDVQTAHEMADAFTARGVRAVALSGETEQGERDRELLKFENKETQVLLNVDLFDEGFDVPAASVALLTRRTESLAKFLQMCGRVLRFMEGKTAKIIDPVRNWERHGMPNWPRVWSLEGRDKKTRGASDDLIPQRVCLGCTQPYEAYYTACPYCGFVPVPAGRSLPEQVEGDLLELDVDGMAALFAKIADANMDDREYVLNQTARRVPPIGRSADLKRHRAAKYRRGVLEQLVGWWVGCQPADRSMSEKYRRFFHRFGVDMGIAFTLNEKDTDALIEKIKRRFAEDIAA